MTSDQLLTRIADILSLAREEAVIRGRRDRALAWVRTVAAILAVAVIIGRTT